MADYDQHGNPLAPAREMSGNIAWAHLMYLLHALSAASGVLTSASIAGAFVFGWPSILAVIINYVTRGNVRGSWLDSHWRWQLRTFWYAALWLLVAGLLAATFIGIPAAILVIVLCGLWVLYRVVRGWLTLAQRQAMPLPE